MQEPSKPKAAPELVDLTLSPPGKAPDNGEDIKLSSLDIKEEEEKKEEEEEDIQQINNGGSWSAPSPPSASGLAPPPAANGRPTSASSRVINAVKSGITSIPAFTSCTKKRNDTESGRPGSADVRKSTGAQPQKRLLWCLKESAVGTNATTRPFDPILKTNASNNWLATYCVEHSEWGNIKEQANKGSYRGDAVPFFSHAAGPDQVLVVWVQNYPSNAEECRQQILQNGIAFLDDEGMLKQKSWKGGTAPTVNIMQHVYSETEQDARAALLHGSAFVNRVPIMADPDWQSNPEKRNDYSGCASITDPHVRALLNDAIATFPNLKAVVVLGKPAFVSCVEGTAFGGSWFDHTLVIQESRMAHGSQMLYGSRINETQRDVALPVFNQIASVLLQVPLQKNIPDDMKDLLLPYSLGSLPDGTVKNSKKEYVPPSELSEEQDAELVAHHNYQDDGLTRKERFSLAVKTTFARRNNQMEIMHTYICDSCTATSFTSYNSTHAGCPSTGTGKFRNIVLFDGTECDAMIRGYCKTDGCQATLRLNQTHVCKVGSSTMLSSLTPPPGFYNGKGASSALMIRKVDNSSGNLLNTFTSGRQAVKDLELEMVRLQADDEFNKNDERWEIFFRRPAHKVTSLSEEIKGDYGLQDGTVVLGDVKYCGVPICLPITNEGDAAARDDDNDSEDEDIKMPPDVSKKTTSAAARNDDSEDEDIKMPPDVSKKTTSAAARNDDSEDEDIKMPPDVSKKTTSAAARNDDNDSEDEDVKPPDVSKKTKSKTTSALGNSSNKMRQKTIFGYFSKK